MALTRTNYVSFGLKQKKHQDHLLLYTQLEPTYAGKYASDVKTGFVASDQIWTIAPHIKLFDVHLDELFTDLLSIFRPIGSQREGPAAEERSLQTWPHGNRVPPASQVTSKEWSACLK